MPKDRDPQPPRQPPRETPRPQPSRDTPRPGDKGGRVIIPNHVEPDKPWPRR